ncbi:hypothetical protein GCM10022419_008160 [Nonomuraea rosea]|uniref:Transcription factor zinc-finger domain-containing protein n=1 Tax=Nonomuraea rosea TaxID=638574 RepID=A0ABP6V9H2_9ACTN
MTDPITCPECQGDRGKLLGGLFLACQFCGGLGWVGGDNEPAEREAKPPPPPPTASNHPVWSDPWIAAAFGCRLCLGARKLTHVDEEAGTLITVPCRCVAD